LLAQHIAPRMIHLLLAGLAIDGEQIVHQSHVDVASASLANPIISPPESIEQADSRCSRESAGMSVSRLVATPRFQMVATNCVAKSNEAPTTLSDLPWQSLLGECARCE
jgi:hypothetical protein